MYLSYDPPMGAQKHFPSFTVNKYCIAQLKRRGLGTFTADCTTSAQGTSSKLSPGLRSLLRRQQQRRSITNACAILVWGSECYCIHQRIRQFRTRLTKLTLARIRICSSHTESIISPRSPRAANTAEVVPLDASLTAGRCAVDGVIQGQVWKTRPRRNNSEVSTDETILESPLKTLLNAFLQIAWVVKRCVMRKGQFRYVVESCGVLYEDTIIGRSGGYHLQRPSSAVHLGKSYLSPSLLLAQKRDYTPEVWNKAASTLVKGANMINICSPIGLPETNSVTKPIRKPIMARRPFMRSAYGVKPCGPR